MTKTHKKIFSTKKTKNRKSKKMHGGGALKAIAKAVGQNEKCNLAIDAFSKNDSKRYTPENLQKKLTNLPFIKAEQQLFKDRFKENLNLDHFEISLDDMNSISNIAINEQKCLAWSGDFDPLEVD